MTADLPTTVMRGGIGDNVGSTQGAVIQVLNTIPNTEIKNIYIDCSRTNLDECVSQTVEFNDRSSKVLAIR